MNQQTLRLCGRSITLCLSLLLLAVAVSAQCSDVTLGLREPLSSSLTNQGNLLVSETGNAALHSGRISIVDPLGNRRTLIDGLPSAINDVNEPAGPAGIFMDLGDALHKLSNAFPYRVTETTTTSAGGQTAGNETTRVLDFAAADRYRVKLSSGDGDEVELITIGDKSYSKEDGKWTEEPKAQKQNQRVDLEKNLADAIKDVTYAGPETINGISCFVYNYTIQMAGYAGTGKTCVRASDGLPLQSDS